jgi:hypothetical protein
VDAVLGISHTAASLASKQSGGIWSGARHTGKLECGGMPNLDRVLQIEMGNHRSEVVGIVVVEV